MYLENAVDVAGFQLELNYDPDVYSLLDVSQGFSESNDFYYNIDNLGIMILSYSDVNAPLNGDLTLFVLTFELIENLSIGNHPVMELNPLFSNQVIAIDANHEIHALTDVNYHFHDVHVGIFGDLNNDNLVTIIDVAMIQLHLANKNTIVRI